MEITESGIKEKIILITSQVMNVPTSEIHEKTGPETLPEWDSLNHMNLILAVEEEFGLHFSDEQVVELLSVDALVKALISAKNVQ